MHIMRYSEWRDTAVTLHMVLQMLGKTMLVWMEPQPEWHHMVLQITSEGFCTGLIPNQAHTFSITVSPREGRVTTRGIDGRSSGFDFQSGKSVAEYYHSYRNMLSEMLCETDFYTVPMETSITTPFEKNTEPLQYDCNHAVNFFQMCVLAHNALTRFAAPFRGKKVLPRFFWGTFDTTAILFSGKPEPFDKGGIIEKAAFDEQLIEFGFWPGDSQVDDPSFFILPYPFMPKDLGRAGIKPSQAFWSKEKMEFFLPLKHVLTESDPEKVLVDFFHSGYEAVSREQKWDNLEWLNRPLIIKKGKRAI